MTTLLIVAGTAFVVLGVVGVFVPVLPTTPFLLLAAACYARSSQRFYDWLLGHRLLGRYIRNYREGRGLPWQSKAVTILLLWASLLYAGIMVVDALWARLIFLVIAVGVTWHLLSLPTLRE